VPIQAPTPIERSASTISVAYTGLDGPRLTGKSQQAG
jgi:hypothetical protein